MIPAPLLLVQIALGIYCHRKFDPERKRRPLRNWLHILLGISLLGIGIASIRLGFRLLGDELWQQVAFYFWIGVRGLTRLNYQEVKLTRLLQILGIGFLVGLWLLPSQLARERREKRNRERSWVQTDPDKFSKGGMQISGPVAGQGTGQPVLSYIANDHLHVSHFFGGSDTASEKMENLGGEDEASIYSHDQPTLRSTPTMNGLNGAGVGSASNGGLWPMGGSDTRRLTALMRLATVSKPSPSSQQGPVAAGGREFRSSGGGSYMLDSGGPGASGYPRPMQRY